MTKREEYFSILKEKFTDANIEEYYELKEDLEEMIEDLLESGMTENEAIDQLSDPEEIAKDYFENLRFEVASEAKYNVVPQEDVDEVYKENKRKIFWEHIVKIKKITKKILEILSILLAIYSIIYLVYEYNIEKNIAKIPLIIILILSLIWINKFKVKFLKYINTAGILLIIGLFTLGFINNSLFYRGTQYYEELFVQDYENIKFLLESDYYMELTTSITSGEDFSILVDGEYTKKDISNFKENKNKKDINIEFGKKNLLNIFTKVNKPRLILFIPENMKFEEFSFKIADGDIRVLDLKSENINLKTKDGDAFIKNVEADNSKIETKNGDITIEYSNLDSQIVNYKGKTILTGNEGKYEINNINGEVKISYSELENAEIETEDSRIWIEDSIIDKLNAKSKTGQIVIKEVEGNINLDNKSGKILAENNSGEVNTKNVDGITIFIDKDSTDGNIKSESGFIKWIHSTKYPIKIEVQSETGQIQNELISNENANKKISIKSKHGDIRIIDKVE